MQIATITSKNQLTLPVDIVRKIGLKVGQKVIVSEEGGKVVITPAEDLVEELAGSLKMPKKWKGRSMEEIIEKSKREYFSESK
ncbi:hypothetical protein A2781_04560 [Candidatus Gottesmanbacteria bacterium RIFCSPHIGHO2_01_FULL_42_27]|uniref:SpoVT-AbrB domain-containing protein n=2 Tax=Candidatus Gottesmaniibacteriota TaxID=1752720 RepID=A0A1F6B9B8_9BACT|nr:MAG: Toxin-antitoxin system, antitoxin component, AbrB famil [Candidatus Gottesmanbacteria bacterium GW2011_GWA2_42_18]OGG12001.1 MAG: hypothetical protein A2781_04560 [Candidatus Gottesmanbacteria bacterium RIFCSPHIGHO2_01_FULL_42_27]OGG20099.1 MAG: hypothetical protein A3E72_03950 [Candidatus Gottesmanbacteria bacterium RIFCSPHIGHO2_12_FULL_43_26]OGG33514.1 MAG: hypothetical protein A2968_01025 [Candidatus Gottesmanbacteria bacterium RIFCSPLOWO2_01_FULL_42_22]OGG34558.1 MAG: hypothetical p